MILSDTKKAKSKYAIKHNAELTVNDEGYVFSPSIFIFIFSYYYSILNIDPPSNGVIVMMDMLNLLLIQLLMPSKN